MARCSRHEGGQLAAARVAVSAEPVSGIAYAQASQGEPHGGYEVKDLKGLRRNHTDTQDPLIGKASSSVE